MNYTMSAVEVCEVARAEDSPHSTSYRDTFSAKYGRGGPARVSETAGTTWSGGPGR